MIAFMRYVKLSEAVERTGLHPHTLRKYAANTVTKSRKIRLYPTTMQKRIFGSWLGTSHYVYNRTLNYLKKLTGKRSIWIDIAINFCQPFP